MKKYGDDAQKARGQITYTNAKADFDAVIAGLITVLSAGQTPASLSSLQEKLSSGASGLSQFCDTVINLLPKTAGQTEKGVGDRYLEGDPARAAAQDAVGRCLCALHQLIGATTR